MLIYVEIHSAYAEPSIGGVHMENYDVVLDFFAKAGKPVKAGEIAEATGIDKKEVDKIMAKLKKEEKIVSPKVCMWEIKK